MGIKARKCSNCGRAVNREWKCCPFCGCEIVMFGKEEISDAIVEALKLKFERGQTMQLLDGLVTINVFNDRGLGIVIHDWIDLC